jgi:hypothetical protein
LQQQINDLEERAMTADLHNSSLSSSCERARERIMHLESQLQSIVPDPADRTMSSPIRHTHTTPQSAPLRYKPTRSQTPSGSPKPAPRTPGTPSSGRRHVQLSSSTPTVSRSFPPFGIPPTSHPTQSSPLTSRTQAAHGSASGCGPLLPQYIDLYHLQHLAIPLNLIGSYTPERNRVQEMIKLGLSENLCNALAEAMALDNGMQSGR